MPIIGSIAAWFVEHEVKARLGALAGKAGTWLWIALGAIAAAVLIYFLAFHKGQTAGVAKVEKHDAAQHAQVIKDKGADEHTAQATVDAIGARVGRIDDQTTELVRARMEEQHATIDATPPAQPGAAPVPVDTARLSASIDGLVARANGQADAADAEPRTYPQ